MPAIINNPKAKLAREQALSLRWETKIHSTPNPSPSEDKSDTENQVTDKTSCARKNILH